MLGIRYTSTHLSKNPRKNEHPRYEKALSTLAIVFACLSSPCQIALTVFDNHGRPYAHRALLFLALGSTAFAAIFTSAVFFSEMFAPSQYDTKTASEDGNEARNDRNVRIRRLCVRSSNVLLVLEIALGVAFTALLRSGFHRVGGVVEWVMAGIFGLYFVGFWGFLVGEEGEGIGENRADGEDKALEEGEETPLLR